MVVRTIERRADCFTPAQLMAVQRQMSPIAAALATGLSPPPSLPDMKLASDCRTAAK